ncbi:MAG: tRNA-dihydrouridine synthase [Synergistaceae bacterium]|nr:tRNA-dihydrouridine synthase [Synergistaceae bacterium]
MERSGDSPLFIPALPGWPREIGGVAVDNPIWLAPLAGISFGSFRRFHRMRGAGLVHTEMVSALGLLYKGRKTKELLYGDEGEAPCVLQIFGSEADDVARGAETALSIRGFEAIEVNMACPMPKVTKKGAGSKLMESPRKAADMMRLLKSLGLPVWAKVRLSPHGEGMLSTADFCQELFGGGADFIFVHGRTPAQRYEGRASRGAVGEIARLYPGRIGGSGDCYSPEDLIDYLERGCAAVLAARGVLRDACLIARTLRELGAELPAELYDPTPEAQADILLELGASIYNNEGESLALMIAKRMLGALFRGFAGASRLRRDGATAGSWEEMERLLRGWRASAASMNKSEFFSDADASEDKI